MTFARLGFTVMLIANGFAAIAAAQEQPMATKEQAREFGDVFMRALVAEDLDGAIGLAKAAVPESADDLDKVREETENWLKRAHKVYGKTVGYEFVGEQAIGSCLIRHDYLLKFERYVLHWYIVFYKSGEHWQPVVFKMNTKIAELFTEFDG